MDMADGYVFKYCFLKQLLFCILAEDERCDRRQRSLNDTASPKQLVQKWDKEKLIHYPAQLQGKQNWVFIQHWNPNVEKHFVKLSH